MGSHHSRDESLMLVETSGVTVLGVDVGVENASESVWDAGRRSVEAEYPRPTLRLRQKSPEHFLTEFLLLLLSKIVLSNVY